MMLSKMRYQILVYTLHDVNGSQTELKCKPLGFQDDITIEIGTGVGNRPETYYRKITLKHP